MFDLVPLREDISNHFHKNRMLVLRSGSFPTRTPPLLYENLPPSFTRDNTERAMYAFKLQKNTNICYDY